MEACTVREFDISQEFGGRGVEVPISEDLVDAIKVCFTDIECALSTQVVGAVFIKVEGDILLEVVN